MHSSFGLFVSLALVAGVLGAVQGKILGNISGLGLGFLVPSLVIHAAGLFSILLLLPFQKIDWRGVLEMPGYLWICGVTGAIAVTLVAFAVQKMGLVATLGMAILAQFATSAILDHFGLLGAVHPFTLTKMAGIFIMLLGLWLILS